MAPEFCPACQRPQRPGVSFCRNCHYVFLGGASLQGAIASRMAVEVTLELMLVLLIAAVALVGAGVVLTAPAA